MKIIVTGGAGFIGSALTRHLIRNSDHKVINVDCLTYAGSLASLAAVECSSRYTFEQVDIRDVSEMSRVLAAHQPDGIIHLAAESHVDRSIDEPAPFMHTNVLGTYHLLEASLRYYLSLGRQRRERFRFVHVSTDEVYGSLSDRAMASNENAAYAPSSPYAATKAASDHLVNAWHRTYGLPTLVTHSTNNYGPFQFPEKLIPLMVRNALNRRPLPVYGDGQNRHEWLFVDDHARALQLALENGQPGENYNIGSGQESTNLALIRSLCAELDAIAPDRALGARDQLITFVQDRKGHDRRYAIDARKIQRDLGWQPCESLTTGLKQTIEWYLANPDWAAANSYNGERLGLARRLC